MLDRKLSGVLLKYIFGAGFSAHPKIVSRFMKMQVQLLTVGYLTAAFSGAAAVGVVADPCKWASRNHKRLSITREISV